MSKVYDVFAVSGRIDINALVHAGNRKHAGQLMRMSVPGCQVQFIQSPDSGLIFELFTQKELNKIVSSKVGTVWVYDEGT